MRPQFASIRYDLSLFFPFVAICIICHLAYDTHFSLFFTICSEYNYIHSQGSLLSYGNQKWRMKFLIPFPDISELGPVPPLGVAPWWTVQSKSSWVSWVKSHRDPWSKLQYTVAKRKKEIVKTIRQCLYGISINVFKLIIALLTGKKLNDDFFQFGALISQTWNFSNFNAVRVIKLGINCDRAHFFLGGGGSGVGRGKVMIASHFGEALLSLPLHLSSESSLGTPWSDWIGAPNGSLPQNRQIFAGW